MHHSNLLKPEGFRGRAPLRRSLPSQHHAPARGPSLYRGRRVACAASEEEPPKVLGDWREFRAKLVSQTVDLQWRTRVSEDNMRLLQMENPQLAAEEVWAHPTSKPEKGGVLVATTHAHQILRDDSLWQSVVLLVKHDNEGSMGFVLNRPTRFTMGKGKTGLPLPVQATDARLLQEMFADSRIYCGGDMAQHIVHLVHGQPHIGGAVEVVPGICIGGEAEACREVFAGRSSPKDFRFFSGARLWGPRELEQQISAGCWYPAACARPLVLKQCLQLPVPFWKEVMELLGGSYAETARSVYRNGGDGLY